MTGSQPVPEFQFNTIEEAIEAVRQGQMIIIADDEDRENEGDLVCAAECITPEMINFMANEGRGLICLTLTPEQCDKLELHLMTLSNTEAHQTAFTISIDAHAKFGVTTGISAQDRAKTIQVAVAPDALPVDLRRPGHIFPLRAKPAGVLERVGQTEASVDIAKLAGLNPSGVICEILKPDGSMMRRNDLFVFAQKHGLKFITVSQIIAYRLRHERTVQREAVATLPTQFGDFQVLAYENTVDGTQHLALTFGDLEQSEKAPLIRMHSECLTGDVFGSLRCDCGPQLQQALKMIADYGVGAVVYLRNHEGRGIGLVNKIKAYALQEQGRDTVEANTELGFAPDLRHYGVGAQILKDLGIVAFKLLTNNPRKIRGLEGYELSLLERVAMPLASNAHNAQYLQTKRDKLGHIHS
jgi:3,4-dihydroxy 2-butanone 4-phosphate synthase / GTP cyclohydrolase II